MSINVTLPEVGDEAWGSTLNTAVLTLQAGTNDVTTMAQDAAATATSAASAASDASDTAGAALTAAEAAETTAASAQTDATSAVATATSAQTDATAALAGLTDKSDLTHTHDADDLTDASTVARVLLWDGTSWPARDATWPAGVLYVSTTDAAATAPTDPVTGDMWARHKDAT